MELITIGLFVLGLLLLIFWLYMIVDSAKNKEYVWLVVIVLLPLLGSIIYFVLYKLIKIK